jgi:hypothetical protein
MTSFKATCRRFVVGSAIASMAVMGSLAGVAQAQSAAPGVAPSAVHADNPAPPGPVPAPPDIQHPPATPIPLPGGGG